METLYAFLALMVIMTLMALQKEPPVFALILTWLAAFVLMGVTAGQLENPWYEALLEYSFYGYSFSLAMVHTMLYEEKEESERPTFEWSSKTD